MKKFLLKALSLVVAAAMLVSCSVFAFAEEDFTSQSMTRLRFNDDGKFRILQIADTQDDMFPAPGMLTMIETALEKYQPDLVVFTGDNTGSVDTKINAKYALKSILSIVDDAGIPFTLVFGNHDAENVSKEYHMSVWRSFENCMAYDAAPEIYGMGTHNLVIQSSDGNDVAYNLWMFDSNMYDENGNYDYIHDDQLDWYVETSNRLKAENGGEPVPSIAFQHIVPYEIRDYVMEVAQPDPNGFTTTNGETGEQHHYALNPEYTVEGSILREHPCPSAFHGNQMSVLEQQGDVNAVFVGHDHVNDFIVNTTFKAADGESIDISTTPGATFQSYGSEEMRGCRVIDIDENDPWNYETFTPTFFEVVGDSDDMKALSFASDNIVVYYISFIFRIFGEDVQNGFIKVIYNIAKAFA